MKVNWTQIAKCFRGLSIPGIGGVSIQPPVTWKDIAKETITFLEDRRVLYNDYELEVPRHCVESVIKIREFLTEQLRKVDNELGLPAHLRCMREACRKFQNKAQELENHGRLDAFHGGINAVSFCLALGELRATFGVHLGIIAAQYKLGMEGNLATILPPPVDE